MAASKQRPGRPSRFTGDADTDGDTFVQFRRIGNYIAWRLWRYSENAGWELTEHSGMCNRNRALQSLGQLRRIDRNWSRGYQLRIDEPLPSQVLDKTTSTNTNGKRRQR